MEALGFGLAAALLWAVHDLLTRKLSQGQALLPLISVVLAAGCVTLLPFAAVPAAWQAMSAPAWGLALASGLAFALAIGSLYRAFSLAPVRLVSPVIGAYPLLSLAIAAGQGRAVTAADWLACAAIVAGIAIVATSTRDDSPEAYAAPPRIAFGWSVAAAIGFAATFALGQAAARQGSDLPVILVGRVTALGVMVVLMLWHRTAMRAPRRQLWVLALMGALDAAALGLVTAAGSLPRAEYASVASSLFGVLTVLLAAWVLHERVRRVQALGIGLVFAGIGALGLQG